jgi:Mg-chelatase subunit ChlD
MEQYPKEFLCPISQELMKDPVIGPDSQTYDRANIVEWLTLHHRSPLSRQPMEVAQLIPNIALRNAIEQAVHPGVPREEVKKGEASGPARIDNLSLAMNTTQLPDGNVLLHVGVVAPKESQRKPAGIICLLDTSASMGDPGTIGAAVESANFSILDLVRHAVKTVVQLLGPDDYLALIAFNDAASLVLPFQKMSMTGKQMALTSLDELSPANNTNIWDAMRLAMGIVDGNPVCKTINTSMWLFTDGVPNINPPRGVVKTVQTFLGDNQPEYTIHTFGFGYNLDSRQLWDLAVLGNGIFCYLPDCNLVGTNFVNCLANALAVSANQATLELTPENATGFVCVGNDMKDRKVETGPVQYGQTRDFVFQFKPTAPSWRINVSLKYPGKEIMGSINQPSSGDVRELYKHYSRGRFNQLICQALNSHHTSMIDVTFLKTIVDTITTSPAKDDPTMDALLRDIQSSDETEGRVAKAFSTFERIQRWGKHYARSVVRAHQLQMCHNFKDPGVQVYGGKLFKEMQHKADMVFCSLPPPTRSIAKPSAAESASAAPGAPGAAAPDMSSYMNSGGGCFSGDGIVLMLDGTRKLVRELKKGDQVVDSQGNSARVVCLVAFPLEIPTKVVRVQGLLITPKHPVRHEGQWVRAADAQPSDVALCDCIYNIVLDRNHVVSINGLDLLTLGHGLHDNPVVEHAYYGSQQVIEDLKKARGWTEGAVTLEHCRKVKELSTGLVSGLCF